MVGSPICRTTHTDIIQKEISVCIPNAILSDMSSFYRDTIILIARKGQVLQHAHIMRIIVIKRVTLIVLKDPVP